LTVVEGAVIHSEYSAYLEAIFETQDIAGRSLMELVFADTDLGADALSQVDAASYACLGEDAINFAFNEHLLVTEISRRMPDGRVKVLDLNWSAITDDSDTIVRLMLCVRDVTELRKLAAEASEQKRRLEMIGEILAVSEEKFHHFIESSASFVSENEHIIRQHSQADHEAIAKLFRNMHTIKGNARTYNLQHLTNIVHETEQRYHELRQEDTDVDWDQDSLMQELARVRAAIESYATINEVSLGRKGANRSDSAERFLMVDIAHIEESLRLIEAAKHDDLNALQSMRETVRQSLRVLGTQGVDEALSGVLESLPSLAHELGKEAPVVRIDDNGYRLRSEASGTLTNVFMHLLRNSVDHGIENAETRRANGKAAAGTIAIQMQVEQGAMQIVLSDDGRGLALNRIREIALNKGLISADNTLSDEETAELIFRPGFSTAEHVTEVSGRGVGMDAVRDFLRREQGGITLRFTDQQQGAAFRQFQTVVTLPARYAVAMAAESVREEAGEPQLDTMAE
jgi:two-component system, chemotaxis family, sensor kinase CheA